MDRNLAAWLQGNVSGARKYISEPLRDLMEVHKIPGAEKEINDAICALNRLDAAIDRAVEIRFEASNASAAEASVAGTHPQDPTPHPERKA